MHTPRGHPHLRGNSFFRYYTFQKPIVIKIKTKSCKEKFLDNLSHFFCFLNLSKLYVRRIFVYFCSNKIGFSFL